MSIGLNTGNNTVRDFNNVMTASPAGKAVPAQLHKAGDGNESKAIARQLNQEGLEINGAAALRNAKVTAFSRELHDQVPARHTFKKSSWNVFKFIGRCAMKACHAIRYAFAPAKKSRAQLQEKLQSLHSEAYAQSRVGTLKAGGNSPTFTCTAAELGAAMGLRGKLTMKPFTNAEIEEIRGGRFGLSDIVQDPNLENCWFLGALCAFLGTKGPGAIQEMISLPPPGDTQGNPPVAQVRLGGETYTVPLGKLCGDGGAGVSASKPWVNLLETAMQMHLMNLYKLQGAAGMHKEDQPSDKVDMSFNNPDIALASLMGVGITGKDSAKPEVDITDNITVQLGFDYAPGNRGNSLNAIRDALRNGQPVLLITPDSKGLSLSTGLSASHTLAVLDVVDAGNGKSYFQILDPYSRSVIVSADIMKDGGQIAIWHDQEPQHQRLQRRDSLASTTARYEADLDNQKANF